MKFVSLCKLYWKHYYKQLIISAVLIAALLLIFPPHFDPVLLALWPACIVGTIYKFGDRLERIKKLKAKGLTEEDITNIEFAKKWGETRTYGLWRYCIRDGGIIAGAGLSLALSVLFAVFFPGPFKKILSEPGSMLRFIGYSYLAGIFAGIILFRILWFYREKRFARLTDPLNTFASKDISLDDLL